MTLKCINDKEVSQKEKDNKKYKCKKCKCYLQAVFREQYRTAWTKINDMEMPYIVSEPDIEVFVCPKCGREYEE